MQGTQPLGRKVGHKLSRHPAARMRAHCRELRWQAIRKVPALAGVPDALGMHSAVRGTSTGTHTLSAYQKTAIATTPPTCRFPALPRLTLSAIPVCLQLYQACFAYIPHRTRYTHTLCARRDTVSELQWQLLGSHSPCGGHTARDAERDAQQHIVPHTLRLHAP